MANYSANIQVEPENFLRNIRYKNEWFKDCKTMNWNTMRDLKSIWNS